MTRTWFSIVLALIASVGSAAAAPWSFELPAGYTEDPGGADRELAQLRAVPRTVSVDAQVYLSPDGNVRLTRMTWLSKFDVTPTKASLESLDRGVASGGGKHGTVIRASRELVGDQLVGDQVIDIEDTRVHMRRIYAADRNRVVTMFTIVCAGMKDALAECERAQETMRLVLPNQASLTAAPIDDEQRGNRIAYLIGAFVGALLVILLIWKLSRRR